MSPNLAPHPPRQRRSLLSAPNPSVTLHVHSLVPLTAPYPPRSQQGPCPPLHSPRPQLFAPARPLTLHVHSYLSLTTPRPPLPQIDPLLALPSCLACLVRPTFPPSHSMSTTRPPCQLGPPVRPSPSTSTARPSACPLTTHPQLGPLAHPTLHFHS